MATDRVVITDEGGYTAASGLVAYSSDSWTFASFMRCLCKPRLSDASPWTGTEMRISEPCFA